MEEHPVPQNVTAFEFHLVGDMTLKQFGYLAAGLSLAYLTFMLILPMAPLLAIPIIITSAVAGAAYAFLPILDRPLDHWTKAFFKAVYSPTKESWKLYSNRKATKVSSSNSEAQILKNRLQIYLSSIGSSSSVSTPVPAKQVSPTETKQTILISPQSESKPQAGPVTASSIPTSSHPNSGPELNKINQITQYTQLLQARLAAAEKEINTLKTMVVQKEQAPILKRVVPQVIPQAPASVGSIAHPVSQPPQPIAVVPVVPHNPQVKVVEPPKQPKTQLILTSLPNVINGIVVDAAGNYLEGVIVIIHNKDGLPVRALKTNKLGQFTGATPLQDGVYTVALEKDNLEFDTLQVTLNNEVMGPLNITAKKGGIH